MENNTSLRWYTPDTPPFQLAGFAWFAQDHRYRRLPVTFHEPFPEAVETLANHTAGGQIRFQTDSQQVMIRVTLREAAQMPHMPITGQCGFDCYVGAAGETPRYSRTTVFPGGQKTYESELLQVSEQAMRNIVLNFPLYDGVEEVQIGLDAQAKLLPPPPYVDDRPIIVYGSSITQGGCASRPGMAYTNILSRWLNRPFINLGFSGSGKGEPVLAAAMAAIPDPALFILDYEANAHLDGLQQTLVPFIRILRASHPLTPILVVSAIPFARETTNPACITDRLTIRDFQQQTIAALQALGDRHISFHDGGTLLGEDFEECTVDGVHPTDLGFHRMAKGLYPVLKGLFTE